MKKHECCWHHPVGLVEPYCCRCEFGVRKANAMAHTKSWHCDKCKTDHPGSHMLDGCPNWLERWNKLFEKDMDSA
ncbi:hypothetical protein J4T96_gp084 [Mycobacterium phage Finemlucis]|uniref:Uncharacterized protein n=1 Tax=Mycobacterium phage Finemlucis TaxID=2015844 RepID=A0A291I9Z1_9CAUD|nr:hypothetical protein J4T96_gp084 [Mycobacterium phage Finemlucis]ATG86495.1 hypothetical protein SEA_FINEMLUCIS_84 [Mycobacterium phage Finemlucis]